MHVDFCDLWSIHEPVFMRLSEWLSEPPSARIVAGRESAASQPYEFIEPGVALIAISGVLAKSLPWWQDSGVTLPDLAKNIRAAANDPSVDAVLLAIDSPGGTVAGTTEVATAVEYARSKKPVVAYVQDLMASAAYWIGAQADKVYASNALAQIGSIGVYGGVIFDTSAMAEKQGVKTYVIKAGENKSFGEFGSKVSAEQVAIAQSRVDQIHAHFKAAVQAGRKMSAGQVEQVSDGRVFLAADALRAGLVDGIKSLDAVTGELVALARDRKKPAENYRMSAIAEQPKAATLAELKAACAGAPSDWILAQLEAGATIQQAQTAFIAHLKAEADKAKADAEKAAAEAAAKAKAGGLGVDPVTGGRGSSTAHLGGAGGGSYVAQETGDARADYDAAVGAFMGKGLSRMEARQQVERANPRLLRDYLLATNPADKHEMIQQKFKDRVK